MDPRLDPILRSQPYPLLFVTVSGAHLYGFASADSDYDLRGAHVLPAREILKLDTGHHTIERSTVEAGLQIDLVTHDLAKFMGLMLKKNGYVLEQLFSPLVLLATPEHAELIEIGRRCVTRFHAHHYLGFAETQWKLFAKESPPRVKPLLYVYRVLLTGLWLMESGTIEANLTRLNERFRLPQLPELIAAKATGAEKQVLPGADLPFHEREYHRLRRDLEQAMATTHLPDATDARAALDDLLVRVRLATLRH